MRAAPTKTIRILLTDRLIRVVFAGLFLTLAGNFPVSTFADGFYSDHFRLAANENEAGELWNDSLFSVPTNVRLGYPEYEGLSWVGSLPLDSLESMGLTATLAERPLFDGTPILIRGQASSDSYWTAVQSKPYYLAQSTSGATAADLAPELGATSSPAISSTSVAPPMDVGTLTPSSGTIAPPCPTDPNPNFFEEPVQTMKRFWEGTSASYTFIPKSGDQGLGLNDFSFKMQFNFPCKFIPHANQDGVSGYWYVSPEFGLQLWSEPGGQRYEMPSQTFDAALAFGSQPQFTKDFGADLWIRLGVASSFKKVNCDAFFIRGGGLGSLRINDQVTAVAGVIYYDRNHYKLLPSGGVKWVPNEKNEWLLVFPNPRLSRYIANLNETKWWAYLQGDIGGGRWLIKDQGKTFNVDYNDYRVGLGVKFDCPSGFNGFFEVGGAFGRELYSDGYAWFKPKNSVYLKGGIAF